MKIIWSRRAIRHLGYIRDHIASDNAAVGAGVAQRILNSVHLLIDHPHMGRAGRIVGTRELVIPGTPYVIPYRVRRGCVELIAVFHGRQKWPERF